QTSPSWPRWHLAPVRSATGLSSSSNDAAHCHQELDHSAWLRPKTFSAGGTRVAVAAGSAASDVIGSDNESRQVAMRFIALVCRKCPLENENGVSRQGVASVRQDRLKLWAARGEFGAWESARPACC